ncbi:PREDICTED: zinc finger CCCH domain-containing protein 6-like [Ipomoea nil]|uniref:zinc finger CCCH domain-containing protein 6-like n=1 Tax=Ipomoea nil TaxID=35883 RepID=UPI000900B8D2|nr:PREDICTED: zinc finger CCCH domain-containing protein 6-like [Ipomoea nil]
MEGLSRNIQSRKEIEKQSRGSWHPNIKFRQVSMRSDELFIGGGEESVELELQKHRGKGVAQQVYVHPPYSIIAPNPSVVLDLEDKSQDDRCIFHHHVPLNPIEEVEEGEVQPPCKICASSSQPVAAKESTSIIHGNPTTIPSYTGLQIDPELIAAIATLVRLSQNDLIDPDLLTMFLSNPQLVEQEMKVLLATRNHLATEKIPKPNMADQRKLEHIALPHAGMPNMAAGMMLMLLMQREGGHNYGGYGGEKCQREGS